MKLTEKEIEAGKSPAGGFTKKQLAEWGVPWPPPAGWRQALVNGTRIPKHGEYNKFAKNERVIKRYGEDRRDYTNDELHDLIRKIVVSVINCGHASDLYEYEDVLEYFGAQIPKSEK